MLEQKISRELSGMVIAVNYNTHLQKNNISDKKNNKGIQRQLLWLDKYLG
jgi:hypothetical protein